MNNVFITGATGNTGFETIRYLTEFDGKITAGVRNKEKAKKQLSEFEKINYCHFDLEDSSTFENIPEDTDVVFLLRPPHISDVEKYFPPLFDKLKKKSINKIVFLSVQGVEKSKVIPHNKIERLIFEKGFEYIFLRPSYFMQNLTTTLYQDIKKRNEIVLPAGDAVFNWIDVKNIAEVGAVCLVNFEKYKNEAKVITGYENKSFREVTDQINKITGVNIEYKAVNPVKFYMIKCRQSLKPGMIIVMIMLHFLPRFQKEPEISGEYEKITGKEPTRLSEFIERNRKLFNLREK